MVFKDNMETVKGVKVNGKLVKFYFNPWN